MIHNKQQGDWTCHNKWVDGDGAGFGDGRSNGSCRGAHDVVKTITVEGSYNKNINYTGGQSCLSYIIFLDYTHPPVADNWYYSHPYRSFPQFGRDASGVRSAIDVG